MAASTALKGSRKVPGAEFSQTAVITGDAAYPNPAGYVFTPASFGLTTIRRVHTPVAATVAAGVWEPAVVMTYAADNETILSFALHLIVNTTGAEVANGVNVAAAVFNVIIEGN